jgi:hypothetical protein
MIEKQRNEPYAPKWEQEEGKNTALGRSFLVNWLELLLSAYRDESKFSRKFVTNKINLNVREAIKQVAG